MRSWFHFRTPAPPPEDPAVSAVEQMFDATSCRPESLPTEDGNVLAEHALWICACVTADDAPTWLICDTAAGFMWLRVADSIEPLELVKARYTGGGHADPAEVLRWLQGDAPNPWGAGGDGYEDPGVLELLRRQING